MEQKSKTEAELEEYENKFVIDTDINENSLLELMPDILNILLIDRTTTTPKKKKNIIWANENYISYGYELYEPSAEILPESITGSKGRLIIPRALKSVDIQKFRTKSKAEVFTPVWVVKTQIDQVEKKYINEDLATYVALTWLEISCGEAPYITTRYHMETGKMISIHERVGFIDRKLQRINREIENRQTWLEMTIKAFKACYGYEWSGDSLLLARENLLYTYREFFIGKWKEEPDKKSFKEIAEIISYNIFQMDGIKYIIPLSDIPKKNILVQLTLFGDEEENIQVQKSTGIPVKIMNWEKNKMERFDSEVK